MTMMVLQYEVIKIPYDGIRCSVSSAHLVPSGHPLVTEWRRLRTVESSKSLKCLLLVENTPRGERLYVNENMQCICCCLVSIKLGIHDNDTMQGNITSASSAKWVARNRISFTIIKSIIFKALTFSYLNQQILLILHNYLLT